jgi:uncharacterized protein
MTEAFSDAFWEGTALDELRLPFCRDCGNRWLPPLAICPRCLSAQVEWRVSSGRGVVVAACQFHRSYFPDLDLPLPYTVLLVRLAEGPLFYANPVDLASVPAIGAAVHATCTRTSSGRVVARFVVDGERE